MALKVRTLTAEEANALKRLASSCTVPHRVVQRTQMVWASAQWGTVPIIARQAEFSAFQVCTWIHRFHQHGLAGLADAPRAGRPRRPDEPIRGKVIALARTQLPYGWSAKRHDTRGKVRGDASIG
jgi:transposase